MKANYGNWVPEIIMKWSWGAVIALCIVDMLCMFLWKSKVISIVISLVLVVFFILTIYMQKCRKAFDFEGGNVMGQIHEFVLSKLSWDGKGELLDIGCGSGALTIRCAKKYIKSKFIGIDYWGKEWSYAKDQCEKNAKIEGVESIKFMQGDAANLPFEDNRFDAAVSNLVFHEVRTQPDKRMVIREALRVVKKGGAFAFHDMFEQKKLYGNMNELIEELKREGIAEIYYEAHTEKLSFIPDVVRAAPWMLQDMGIIYGIK